MPCKYIEKLATPWEQNLSEDYEMDNFESKFVFQGDLNSNLLRLQEHFIVRKTNKI